MDMTVKPDNYLSILPETTPRILIVDDEPLNIQVLGQVLSNDYKVFFAKNGFEAIEFTTTHKPDLVLLDITMPGLAVFPRRKARAPALWDS